MNKKGPGGKFSLGKKNCWGDLKKKKVGGKQNRPPIRNAGVRGRGNRRGEQKQPGPR